MKKSIELHCIMSNIQILLSVKRWYFSQQNASFLVKGTRHAITTPLTLSFPAPYCALAFHSLLFFFIRFDTEFKLLCKFFLLHSSLASIAASTTWPAA